MALQLRLGLIVLLSIACVQLPAAAQEQSQPTLARRWLDDALAQQSRADDWRRYLAAPLMVLGGGLLLFDVAHSPDFPLSIPPVAASAALVTGAAAMWLSADAYASSRWFSRASTLALFALAMRVPLLQLRCRDDTFATDCRAAFTIAGSYLALLPLTLFLFDLLLPPPDPRTVAQVGPGEYERVHEFLRRRERQRRASYFVIIGLSATAVAAMFIGSARTEVAALHYAGYVTGGAIGLTILALGKLLLRSTADERLAAGLGPDD